MRKYLQFFLVFGMLVSGMKLAAQEEPMVPTIDYSYKPLTLKLDDSDYKYIRFLIWNQFWLTGSKQNDKFRVTPMIRRFRFLTYAQFTPNFMILAHWGLNGLTPSNMDPLGNQSNAPQLFLHAAWLEYQLFGEVIVFGGGLHYWNGPSRQSTASTLTFMTIDNYRQGWSKIGLTDQFARNMGMFLKGQYGRFTYNISLDAPIVNSMDVSRIAESNPGETLYIGRYLNANNNWLTQGYFKYDFLGIESCKLPYKPGTHLSKNHVLALGAGYVYHPGGSATEQPDGGYTFHDMKQFAVDLFYDVPFARTALSAYAVFYYFDYGPEYIRGNTYGTGTSAYANLGYLLPTIGERMLLQPYAAISFRDFEAHENQGSTLHLGTNLFVNFHQAKVTLEYLEDWPGYSGPAPGRNTVWRMQFMIYM